MGNFRRSDDEANDLGGLPILFSDWFTLWLCQKFAIEHGPVEIVDLPIDSMVDLSIVM